KKQGLRERAEDARAPQRPCRMDHVRTKSALSGCKRGGTSCGNIFRSRPTPDRSAGSGTNGLAHRNLFSFLKVASCASEESRNLIQCSPSLTHKSHFVFCPSAVVSAISGNDYSMALTTARATSHAKPRIARQRQAPRRTIAKAAAVRARAVLKHAPIPDRT